MSSRRTRCTTLGPFAFTSMFVASYFETSYIVDFFDIIYEVHNSTSKICYKDQGVKCTVTNEEMRANYDLPSFLFCIIKLFVKFTVNFIAITHGTS